MDLNGDVAQEEKHRLFIAMLLPDNINLEFEKNLSQLPGIKLLPKKWHFTVLFLGNVTKIQKQQLIELFNTIDLPNAFVVNFTHIGAFPNIRTAKAIWLGIKEDQGAQIFNELNRRFKERLPAGNFFTETRSFLPHVTVSRFAKTQDISIWIKDRSFEKRKVKLNKIVLYESILEPNGSHYIELASRTLVDIESCAL